MDNIKKTAKALEANGFDTVILQDKSEVIPYLDTVMKDNDSCAVGGSVTLTECGILDYLRSGRFNFYDRYAESVDVEKVFHDSFNADWYFTSCNALTVNGELILIDGRGNRVAAVCYGPKKVVIVAGINKICENVKEAWYRVKTEACGRNARRLGLDTWCAKHDHCVQQDYSETNYYEEGVRGCKNTICSDTLLLSRQRSKGRITVVLVNENLGY